MRRIFNAMSATLSKGIGCQNERSSTPKWLTFVLNRISLRFDFVHNRAHIQHIAIVKVPLIAGIIFEYVETFLDTSLDTTQPVCKRA